MSSNTIKYWLFGLTITFILFSPPNKAFCQASEAISVVEAVPATYPPLAIVLRAAGKVTVKVEIAPNGRVDSVDALTGPESLRKPAKTAAARWLFNKKGSNKKMRTAEIHFIFELLPQGATSEELLPTFLPPFTVKVRDGLGRVVSLKSSMAVPEADSECILGAALSATP
jgi:hypothetical protein